MDNLIQPVEVEVENFSPNISTTSIYSPTEKRTCDDEIGSVLVEHLLQSVQLKTENSSTSEDAISLTENFSPQEHELVRQVHAIELMANFCLDFETEEEEANVSFISPKENLLCNDSEVPLKSNVNRKRPAASGLEHVSSAPSPKKPVHPYHLPSPLPTFHQHGVVISADKNRSVVLPYGGWENDGVFIIENNASGVIPISTILDIFDWKEFNGSGEKTYKGIKGTLTRFQVLRKPIVKEQTVICTKTDGFSFFVANVFKNEIVGLDKSVVSDAPKEGNVYVMKSVQLEEGLCHDIFTNSYIPADLCNFGHPSTTKTDVIMQVEHQENGFGLRIPSDSEENWRTVGQLIIASSAVLAAKCKHDVATTTIAGEITDAIIKDKSVLRFTIALINQPKHVAQLQNNYFSFNSTAVLLQPDLPALQLKVAGSSFTVMETAITFDTNYELYKKNHPTTPDYDINGTTVEIKSTPPGDFFLAFGHKVVKQQLPIFHCDASKESRLIFSGLFGNAIEVEPSQKKPETYWGSILKNTTEEQTTILKNILGSNSVLNVIEASAGSGKTFVNCKIIEHYISQNSAKPILATTQSNSPGFDIGTKIEIFCQDILILCSKSAAKKLNDENTRLLGKFGLQKRFSEALEHPDLSAMQKEILTNAQRFIINHDDAESNKCATLFDNCNYDQISQCIIIILELLNIKVLIATISMATRHISAIADNVEYCLVDEAGTVPQIVVASFVAELPQLKKLVLVGDTKQHDGFDITMPKFMKKFGYESVLQAAKRCQKNGCFKGRLTKSFRFVKEMIPLLSACCYGGKLVAGNTEPSVDYLAGVLHFQTAYRVAFVNCPGTEVECFPSSKMNKEQAEISIQIALQLKQFHPDKSVIVVSPYSKQNEYVKNCSKINDITTVEHSSLDALQGAERDFVILNLTISGKQNNNTFINENGRFTVAVTRARLGLIIVGDLILMQKLCSWKQFIQMLKEKKNIVH